MSCFVTTPIYYVNAQPHLGHAYTTIVADTYSRFRRLFGEPVRLQTGTDEHGDKIAEAAAREQIAPAEFVDRISALYRASWPLLSIEPDNFIRTTDAVHIQTVQRVLQQVYDQGDIYFGEYSGLYCKGCERFLTEKELVDGKCPDHQQAPESITEQNYFFRMSKYQRQLIAHIEAHPDFISPVRYKNEALAFLSEPLEDLCISRPTTRLTWGIALPFDDRFVTYVWFDALINYLTGIGYQAGAQGESDPVFDQYWAGSEHVIAKDILKPHAIYWPTMLLALGLPLYHRLRVHGFWNVNDLKMSKSIGNVVRPAEMVAAYGVDTVRYFLLREMSFGLDASYSSEAILARHNADLANDLGNLLSRSLAMLEKYCQGLLPAGGEEAEADQHLRQTALQMLQAYEENMRRFQFHRALQSVWELISQANKYIVASEPWLLAKDPARQARLQAVLYNLGECLRLLALVLGPVMPQASAKMALALGLSANDRCLADFRYGARWGLSVAGTPLRKTEAIFPRMEAVAALADPPQTPVLPPQNDANLPPDKGGLRGVKGAPNTTAEQCDKAERKKKTQKEGRREQMAAPGVIDISQFQQLDLRVAEVVGAERIAKSDRLLKLTVMAPEERTIVAGIAEYYSPEEMVGRLVVIVANLQPVELMGVQSQGMVLAAQTVIAGKKRLTLITVSEVVAAGSRVA